MPTAPALTPQLRAILRQLPAKPGVYLMKDATGRVLYVGKADVLRNRVRSYFGSGPAYDARIGHMITEIAAADFMTRDEIRTTSPRLERLLRRIDEAGDGPRYMGLR